MPVSFSNRSTRLVSVMVVTASTVVNSIPLLAQDTDRPTVLEEVVVTAQRREESLQDTPIAITAFTADQLQNLGVYAIDDIGYKVPNMAINYSVGSNTNMNVSIRGFSNSETQLLQEPKVGIYVDGVIASKTAGSVFDVADLERIEVLRGPQGTLFGRNTTGGAISVTTRKPSGELDGKLQASAGNFDYQRWGGSVDLPEWHNVSTLVSYYRMKNDGWADNNYTGPAQFPAVNVQEDLASENNEAYRFALRWLPIDNLTVDYSYDKTDNKGVPAPFQVTDVLDELYNGFEATPYSFETLGGALFQEMAATIGDPDKQRRDYTLDAAGDEWLNIDGHILNVAWNIGDITLKYIYGNRSTDLGNHGSDLDGGAYMARDLVYGTLEGDDGPIRKPGIHASIPKSHLDMESNELQFIGDAMNSRLNYTGGLFYYDEKVEEELLQTFSWPIESLLALSPASFRAFYAANGYCPPDLGGTCIGSQRMPLLNFSDREVQGVIDNSWGGTSKSWAAYGQTAYAVTDQIEVTLGARYTEDEKDQYLFNENIPESTPDNPVRADEKWNQWTYLANVSYQFTDEINSYLKYSTGYNSGGFNGRAQSALAFQTPYAEEEVETWELGLKSQWFENRLRLNLALFTNDFSDMQLQQFETGAGGGGARTVNAGKSTLQGFEMDFTAIPVEGLTVNATYGYLDSQLDEYINFNPITGTQLDIADVSNIPTAPENTASLGVQYDFAATPLGEPSMRVDVGYRDELEYGFFPISATTANARTLVDARIMLNAIPLGDWRNRRNELRVALWGKNLTDEEYRNFGVSFGALGFAGVNYGEPLSYGIDLQYTFN